MSILISILLINWILVTVEGLNNWNIFNIKKTSPSRSSSDIVKSEIISLLPQTNRGLKAEVNANIVDSIKRISTLPSSDRAKASVDGKWKLLWTTEKVSVSLINFMST